MSQPTAYSKLTNYTTYQSQNPTVNVNGASLDAEFVALQTTLSDVRTNLALIQRDDGRLKNGSVHADALSSTALALIESTLTPRGFWVTATSYAVGDVVEVSATAASYICSVAHTSGTFDTDHLAGNWVILSPEVVPSADLMSFDATTNIPQTDVQAAIEQVEENHRTTRNLYLTSAMRGI